MSAIMPFMSSVISFVFVVAVLKRYLSQRGPHLLLWALGLTMYGLGGLCEALIGAFGWRDFVFRIWYLLGAMLVAAYLGQGTVYLLAPRRRANILMVVLLLGSLYGAFKVLGAELDPSRLIGDQLSGHAIVSGGVRILTPFFNIYGLLTLVGGAIYSAWIYWRRRTMPDRAVGNALIAAGALSPALGGTLSRFGLTGYLYVSELVGVILMFIGFLRATAEVKKG